MSERMNRMTEVDLKAEIEIHEGILADEARAYKEKRAKRFAHLCEIAEALAEKKALRNAKARLALNKPTGGTE